MALSRTSLLTPWPDCNEAKSDHEFMSFLLGGAVRISNSRAFFEFGILARAAALSATSMSARMTPGSS